MKTTTANQSKPQQVPTHKSGEPDNKNNLDSRKNEEWDTKGDDVTHNKKETKEEKKPHQHH